MQGYTDNVTFNGGCVMHSPILMEEECLTY